MKLGCWLKPAVWAHAVPSAPCSQPSQPCMLLKLPSPCCPPTPQAEAAVGGLIEQAAKQAERVAADLAAATARELAKAAAPVVKAAAPVVKAAVPQVGFDGGC